ncbi:ArsR/SmtB family transcription factor [Thermoactinomyces mirandus]|uniref:Helix-turn-helix transcriptional regulator n=1 Tax=Thermoactinomyces mirandus TaxID=2756294 RepID=A0A7W1XT24_9BACL|nr:metalloregulator ArsR/SmtB family transcription factor [Thermoactinomyces mirandus]MBA4602743.1 helix-turn-helix transcriptional regulator [Thermoactinomyces mirandus]
MTLSTEKFAQIAKALSDPTRIKILELVKARYDQLGTTPVACCPDGVCVCVIQKQMNMAQSKVSYHIRELKQASLLHEMKQGKWNFYSINTDTLQAYQKTIQERYLIESEDVIRATPVPESTSDLE